MNSRRKLLSAIMALCIIGVTNAQVLQVQTINKVSTPSKMLVNTANISPDGKYIIVSEIDKSGLTKIDLTTNKTTKISKNGDGYDVKISADGQNVVYQEYTTDVNKLRYTTLKTINVNTLKERTLVASTRNLDGISMNGNKVNIVENRKISAKKLTSTSDNSAEIAVTIINGQLCVSQNGTTKVISPQGTNGKSYLWPELSPDGKKICYYLSGTGAFICDLTGRNVKSLGILRAAKWVDNNVIVGMRDYDNGVTITKSSIIAKNIANLKEQELTPKNIVATYPAASTKAISFVTPAGELYKITLK